MTSLSYYSVGASQKNGSLVAICLNFVRLSVNVALNNRVCLEVGNASNITSKSSSNEGSNNLSASSRTYIIIIKLTRNILNLLKNELCPMK